MNKLVILVLCLLFSVSSCKVAPFFIPDENKKEKLSKREDRLIKRRDKTEEKITKKEEKIRRKKDKLEQIEGKIDSEVKVSPEDSLQLVLEKARIDSIKLSEKKQEDAEKIINARRIEYETISLKSKMRYIQAGKKQSFNANFKLSRDSAIWVSINAMGLEVARAYITPVRVQAIDRINKIHFDYSYNDIQKLINIDVDFNTLQEIIVGNPVAFSGDVYSLDRVGGIMNIDIRGPEFINKLTYQKSDSTLRQMQLQVFRGNYVSNILGMLSDYTKEERRLLPSRRVYNIEDSKAKLSLEMDIQKVKFNEQFRMPFSVPSSYEKK